jgi:hypothetical protein
MAVDQSVATLAEMRFAMVVVPMAVVSAVA